MSTRTKTRLTWSLAILLALSIIAMSVSSVVSAHLAQALDLMKRTRDKYPWQRVVSHTFPLEQINEAFAAADQGQVTRAAIVP